MAEFFPEWGMVGQGLDSFSSLKIKSEIGSLKYLFIEQVSFPASQSVLDVQKCVQIGSGIPNPSTTYPVDF